MAGEGHGGSSSLSGASPRQPRRPRSQAIKKPPTGGGGVQRGVSELSPAKGRLFIKNKSTASGGETPKGSAVPGVPLIHRDLRHMNGTLFRRGLRDCEPRVSTVLGGYPIRRCIHEQEKLQRDQEQGALNLDSTERPLLGPGREWRLGMIEGVPGQSFRECSKLSGRSVGWTCHRTGPPNRAVVIHRKHFLCLRASEPIPLGTFTIHGCTRVGPSYALILPSGGSLLRAYFQSGRDAYDG